MVEIAAATPFDRHTVRMRRDRAADMIADHGFLFGETGGRLMDRLADIRRSFPVALDLGCHDGGLGARLQAREGTEHVIQCDLSPGMTYAARAANRLPAAAADEEFLPFAPGSLDLVVSNLSLHWVNDLPGALTQVRKALRPDGLFLACLLGGATLTELRDAMMNAELAVEGGVSPRVSPFADVRAAGDLLSRAGFALPVADLDTIRVSYPDPLSLMRDLRNMGESNSLAARRKFLTRRSTLAEAVRLYPKAAEKSDEENGRIEARFDIVWLLGWAPAPGQPKPLAPGSARTRLAEALNTDEIGTGDPTPRPPGTG